MPSLENTPDRVFSYPVLLWCVRSGVLPANIGIVTERGEGVKGELASVVRPEARRGSDNSVAGTPIPTPTPDIGTMPTAFDTAVADTQMPALASQLKVQSGCPGPGGKGPGGRRVSASAGPITAALCVEGRRVACRDDVRSLLGKISLPWNK